SQGAVSLGDINRKTSLSVGGITIFEQNIFQGLLDTLEANGYAAEETYFVFPYDWRLDLDNSLDSLNSKIEQIKILTGFDSVDVVAHSMGGLLVKDYLQTYGKDSVNKLIFVGTPHLGAPKAGKALLEGDNFDIHILNNGVMKDLAENYPAVYELLPTQKYFDQFTGYITKYEFLSTPPPLDYGQTKEFLLNERNLNSIMYAKAETLFSKNLQDMDFSGLDVYNIAGCKTSTQSAYQLSLFGNIGRIGYSSGDGTVPLPSLDYLNVATSRKYYVKNGSHSKLPSMAGVKELILDILNDQNIALPSNISHASNICDFKGKTLTWRSPVEVHVYSQGKHSGPAVWGLENSIPGVDYEIIDGEKFIFLPTDEGQEYDIQATGETAGTFDLLISENNNGAVGNTFVYDDVSVVAGTPITFPISETSIDNAIMVDQQALPADSQIPGERAGDLVPPEIAISYDQFADQYVFAGVDNLDPSPPIVCNSGSCTASDHAGNQTVITYSLIDRKVNNWLSVKSITYNHGKPVTPLQNTFYVQFRERREQLRDFDQFIKIKQDEKVRINYQKRRNQSVVTHKLKGEKQVREVFSGFKYLELITDQGNLDINIK
ncbi:MAG: alpha/beta fold hydrolase, partial [Patescibacteria group bacterium]|nr:alpha/beta fold hydrolase [Patescibacteria group bacterium]